MYEFNERDAYEFARVVGIEAKPKGDNLQFKTCPYCKGGKGHDKGTFAISLRNGSFNCLRSSCGARGNMIVLAKDFSEFSLGRDVDEYYKPKREYRELPTPKEPIIPKDKAIEYLASRGISEKTVRDFQITCRTDNPDILAFSHYDDKGKLQCVKYRNTNPGDNGSKEFFEKNTRPILYGMWLCKGKDALIVTEGQIDALSVYDACDGCWDVVSVPNGCKGMTFFPYCWDFLKQYKSIIIFGDRENGKITLVDDFKRRLGNVVSYVEPKGYKECKDANEILLAHGKEGIFDCIMNHIAQPRVDNIVDISEVEEIDPFEIEKLSTGVSQLDTLLYGGIPFGYVHIVGGKRGLGKSTFASQILAEAINQDYKCMAYSGELTNSNFKSWLMYQLASPRNITDNTTSSGKTYWKVRNSSKALMNNWMRGKLYLYDSSNVSDERENLIKTIEDAVNRYGVRIVLIDNLMTAIDLTECNKDKYEQQSQFVKNLVRLALNYNLIILLVAHKRKNQADGDTNDEVSGSSDITNLAGVVMSYDKDNESENEFDRK